VLRSFSDGKLRQPFTIVANRGGLLVRDEFYPSDDIAELALVEPSGAPIANFGRRGLCGHRRGGRLSGMGRKSRGCNVAVRFERWPRHGGATKMRGRSAYAAQTIPQQANFHRALSYRHKRAVSL